MVHSHNKPNEKLTTVEPRLANTLLRRTPLLNARFWPVPNTFPRNTRKGLGSKQISSGMALNGNLGKRTEPLLGEQEGLVPWVFGQVRFYCSHKQSWHPKKLELISGFAITHLPLKVPGNLVQWL